MDMACLTVYYTPQAIRSLRSLTFPMVSSIEDRPTSSQTRQTPIDLFSINDTDSYDYTIDPLAEGPFWLQAIDSSDGSLSVDLKGS